LFKDHHNCWTYLPFSIAKETFSAIFSKKNQGIAVKYSKKWTCPFVFFEDDFLHLTELWDFSPWESFPMGKPHIFGREHSFSGHVDRTGGDQKWLHHVLLEHVTDAALPAGAAIPRIVACEILDDLSQNDSAIVF